MMVGACLCFEQKVAPAYDAEEANGDVDGMEEAWAPHAKSWQSAENDALSGKALKRIIEFKRSMAMNLAGTYDPELMEMLRQKLREKRPSIGRTRNTALYKNTD